MDKMDHDLGEDVAPVSDEYNVVYLAWKHGVSEERVRKILRLDEPPRAPRFLMRDGSAFRSRPRTNPLHFF